MTIRTSGTIFIGITVNPKTHEPVFVHRAEGYERTVQVLSLVELNPAPAKMTLTEMRARRDQPRQFAYATIGEGYLESTDGDKEYLAPVEITGYPRVHTPVGIKAAYQGRGFGTCLYAGCCMLASAAFQRKVHLPRLAGSGDGISSTEKSRSDDADAWWDSARSHGLVRSEYGEVETDSEPEEETERLEDEDLTDYMSPRGRDKVYDAIRDAISGYSEWYPVEFNIRGDIERTIERESRDTETIRCDVLSLPALTRSKLVALVDPFEGDMAAWARAVSPPAIEAASGVCWEDVILALNVANQDLEIVGKLALIAKDMGAKERDVTDFVMRARLGLDLPRTHQPPVFMERNPAPTRKRRPPQTEHGVAFRQNPSGGPIAFESPPLPQVASEREIMRLLGELEERRQSLGWDTLEDLP